MKATTLRLALAALLVCLAARATPAMARTAEITRPDGSVLKGEYIGETNESYILEISNIRTEIPKDQTRSITFPKSVTETYMEMRAALEDDDLDGRYRLAYMLYEQGAFDLALRELNDLKKTFPDEERIDLLLRVVTEQKERATEPAPARDTPAALPDRTPSRDEVTRPDRSPRGRREIIDPELRLTDEQVNLIRLWEYDFKASSRTRVAWPRELDDVVLKQYSTHDLIPRGDREQARWRGSTPETKLRLLFALRARDLYPQVKIAGDPAAMADFKRDIHASYVLGNCATQQCHGSLNAGEFVLFPDDPRSDRTVYTNFYILTMYENAEGKMIDRNTPVRSLLIQYGLPAAAARTPHPQVPGWRPAWREAPDSRDRLYQNLITWIGRTLYQPQPSYGLGYEPPHGQPISDGAAATPATPAMPDEPAPVDADPVGGAR